MAAKILFLDDDPERHRRFLMSNIGRAVVQAWHYDGARRVLDAHVFDEAHLDHDLGGGETGTDVALYIAAMPAEKRPRLCVLHSFNDAGWRRMAAILDGAEVPWVRQQFGVGLAS